MIFRAPFQSCALPCLAPSFQLWTVYGLRLTFRKYKSRSQGRYQVDIRSFLILGKEQSKNWSLSSHHNSPKASLQLFWAGCVWHSSWSQEKKSWAVRLDPILHSHAGWKIYLKSWVKACVLEWCSISMSNWWDLCIPLILFHLWFGLPLDKWCLISRLNLSNLNF